MTLYRNGCMLMSFPLSFFNIQSTIQLIVLILKIVKHNYYHDFVSKKKKRTKLVNPEWLLLLKITYYSFFDLKYLYE